MSGLGAELHKKEKKEENKMDTVVIWKNLIWEMQRNPRNLSKLFSEISKANERDGDLAKYMLFKKWKLKSFHLKSVWNK